MADNPLDTTTPSTTFPDPPPFWRSFTPDRLSRYEALKTRYADQTGLLPQNIIRIPDNVPEDLTDLQPPPEPRDGKWRLFGEEHTLKEELQSLEAGGIERLAPPETELEGRHVDRAFVLKRLAKSLLLNFLELVGVMGIAPEQGAEKVQDIRTLLLNLHHMLNEYRPHQAREQLIALMQDQLDAKRAETAGVRAVVDKAKRVLEGLGSIEVPPADGGGGGTEVAGKSPVDSVQARNYAKVKEEARRARSSAAWGVLDGEFS